MTYTMSSRRMNQFISFINNGKAKSELNPPIKNEYEDKFFDNMLKEFTEKKKENPDFSFLPVESDW